MEACAAAALSIIFAAITIYLFFKEKHNGRMLFIVGILLGFAIRTMLRSGESYAAPDRINSG